MTPDGAQALVTNSKTGTLSVISLADGVVSTLSVGSFPEAVAVSPDGRFGFVVTSSHVVRFERVTS